LDESQKTVVINKVIYPEYIHREYGLGMPISKSPGEFGDMLIKFKILFPDSISEEQRGQVTNLFDENTRWRK